MYSSLNQVSQLAVESFGLNFDSQQTGLFLKQSHYLVEISPHQYKSLCQNLFRKAYHDIEILDSQ